MQQDPNSHKAYSIKPWQPPGNISRSPLTYCHKTKYAQFLTHELLIHDLHSVIVKQVDNKQKKSTLHRA